MLNVIFNKNITPYFCRSLYGLHTNIAKRTPANNDLSMCTNTKTTPKAKATYQLNSYM